MASILPGNRSVQGSLSRPARAMLLTAMPAKDDEAIRSALMQVAEDALNLGILDVASVCLALRFFRDTLVEQLREVVAAKKQDAPMPTVVLSLVDRRWIIVPGCKTMLDLRAAGTHEQTKSIAELPVTFEIVSYNVTAAFLKGA